MPPFYGFGPENGLHVLKDEWCQKEYHEVQSQTLSANLTTAISATNDAAHVRSQGFQLLRPLTIDIAESEEERQLESAMMVRWCQPNMWSIPGAWNRLVAFQVPLFGQRDKGRWGYIDLLGVAPPIGLPVVIELKRSPKAKRDGKTENSETPLKMVLEAAAYAIALRQNWSAFRAEWIDRLTELKAPNEIIKEVPKVLTKVPLVAAAPASFWLDWLPYTSKGQSMKGWGEFKSLLANFASHNLPVTFVSISGNAWRPESLAVQPLTSLPWSP